MGERRLSASYANTAGSTNTHTRVSAAVSSGCRRWSDMARELDKNAVFFTGDGETNHFREGY